MALFYFQARDRNGRSQSGQLEALDNSAALGELRARGWLVTELSNKAPEIAQEPWYQPVLPSSWLPIRAVDLILSLQQLALMLRSGLTILAALRTLEEQARRRRMARVWQAVRRRVEDGSTLAEALARHPCFDELVIQLVRVGEQTGSLEPVLRRASAAIEQRRNLRNATIQALAYPAIVLLATLGVVAFMIFNLIPKLETFLSALGRRLPPSTQLLLNISHFARDYVLQGLILFTAAIIGTALIYSYPPGRRFFDALLLRIPIIGRLLKLSGTILFARALELLLRSGVTLIEALRSLERLLPNRYLAQSVAEARERVLQGSDLAEPLSQHKALDPMLPKMIAVGEQAGTLEEVLDECARFYEEELQRLIKLLGVLIEPAIIAIVGGIVGYVYIAVFMALYAFA